MEAYRNSSFKKVLHQADLVTPDGKPLVWMLRLLGIYHQNQVPGMEVFLYLCNLAEKTGIPIYFVGSTEDILSKIRQKLDQEYPILKVAGMKSIPLMSIDEIRRTKDRELIEEINESGAGIVFVCLGCPKQEIWMSQYQGLIKGVMIGVGAVFSMYAGITPRAPYLIQHSGLEWLYRLLQEPRRLWHRYSSTIPPFIYLAIRQILTPYKEQSRETSWRLSEENILVDVETLNFSPEKLGAILIRQNIISTKELNQALSQQILSPNLKIGEILVRCNFISLSQLKFYLKNQNIKLGQLLIERKNIKQRSLNNILNLQNNTNNKLGEILIEQKIISKNRLRELLVEQYIRRKGLFLTEDISINYDFSSQSQKSLLEVI
ncbi:WecB/TagA/CpsF family glycosyltransferase [Pleurocapsa sp. PCC 7319]|uniref:WecB/TagA/CpsF family glycosyltransferase n=1 Tax=Pleurocapsa sp. PCC 7319 TaxID=118161 RepID=UPI001ED98B9D|nr:WecB/TagA/CpsF family glycosyltransferase [Pleurocapsa sp. PCC 7319]